MKNLIAGLLTTLLALPSVGNAVCEDRLALHVGGWSKHFIARGKDKPAWNETHDAVMVECNSYSFAEFVNSQGHHSIGVGRNFFINKYKKYDWSLYIAAWTGYDEGVTGKGVIPVVAPKLIINIGAMEVSTYLTPVVGFVTVGLEW